MPCSVYRDQYPFFCLSNSLRFKVIENQKTRAQNFDDETDMVDAFVACGGRMDKTGHVKRWASSGNFIGAIKVAPH